ncbi:MAG: ABC transporter substrate-binding protein, partial [Candidatus Hodarchaeota archaeon]
NLKDKNVRLAISHLFPRGYPVYDIGGHGRTTNVPFPQESPYYPDISPMDLNYTIARNYMAKAGYNIDLLPPLTETTPAFEVIGILIVFLTLKAGNRKRNRKPKTSHSANAI